MANQLQPREDAATADSVDDEDGDSASHARHKSPRKARGDSEETGQAGPGLLADPVACQW